MIGNIYVHVNKTSGKVYVGQSRNIKERWRSRYREQPRFSRSIKKYGWDGFDHLILASGIEDQEKLNNLEKVWIILLRSTNRNLGYNIAPGGFLGSTELARMGGIASNRNPDNRYRLSKLTTFEIRSSGGKIGGQKNVETGQIISLGRSQGKKNKENGHWDRVKLLGTLGASKRGREQGIKNALRPGYMSEISKKVSHETRVRAGRIGGKKGGVAANHLRWHVKRGFINSACSLCRVEN